MSIILGINGYPFRGHDPAAALIVDGVIVAAVEEERLCRIKRGMGLPPEKSIQEVIRIANVSAMDIESVALPWLPHAMGYDDSVTERELRNWLTSIGLQGQEVQIRFVEHHTAHAYSGLAFANEITGKKFGILVIDGAGESTGGAAFSFDKQLKCLWHLEHKSSLGLYYEAVTKYLGFNWGEEGKTMGLAAYGRQQEIVLPEISDSRFLPPLPAWKGDISPKYRHEEIRRELVERMRDINGSYLTFNQRADIALAAQEAVAERIMIYVRELAKDVEGLLMAGGVALNCAINAKVADYCNRIGIEFVIPPPASDTGVALGAAVAVCIENSENLQTAKQPFLGAYFSFEEIRQKIQSLGLTIRRVTSEEILSQIFDDNLACGWFEGRCEIGPRALGKRSIIARPDNTLLRDRINVLKGRESWRPLAPSLTVQEFKRSFPNSVPSKYMLINATNPRNSKHLQGVIHVDGSARPQVVDEKGSYLSLLLEAGKTIGCEALICTSFNRAGEPIVYSPEDAIKSAIKMNLDALAGDGWILRLDGGRK